MEERKKNAQFKANQRVLATKGALRGWVLFALKGLQL
jgi:hypothetical protein